MTEEQETSAAIDVLVRLLRDRGDADDEPFAAGVIAALKARGWRPTNARPYPDWHQRRAGSGPDAGKPGGAGYLAAKEQLAARAQGRPAQGEVPAARPELPAPSDTPPGTVPGGTPAPAGGTP